MFTVANGVDAIVKIKSSPSDDEFRLLLLDQNMPILSGLQTAEYLRSSGYGSSRLDIVMVTGDAHIPNTKVKQLELSQILLKPVERSQLQSVLTRVKSRFYT